MPSDSHRYRSTVVAATLLALLATTVAHADEPKAAPARKANRLAKETSPYLLLHAHNPVDWYPWGPEAFAKAKAEGKPIFLSIGYSSCYWCHVMERESFMDESIAKALNEGFVCIKVDREERPDVDQVYMLALQAFSGSGGWPMSMFLMPDGRPFFGGTYFPPQDKEGRPGFGTLVKAVGKAWSEKRDLLERDATQLSDVVKRAGEASVRKIPLTRALASAGRASLADQFDPEYGGFGFDPARPKRPKFPEPANLIYLLDQHRRLKAAKDKDADAPLAMVLRTLDRMARGGIRDHLAGGYHRYSTVRDWSVPHFEKMLYDNAQLAEVHLLAFEITGDPRWRVEAEATLAFLRRSMTSPEGGFYAALDAESEGEEGRTYVWSREQVKEAIDPSGFMAFAKVYGLDGSPNFENGRFVLLEPNPRVEVAAALGVSAEVLEAQLAPARARLLKARESRPAPLLDDKVITSWNGLAIGAHADAYRVLKVQGYRDSAERAADFLMSRLMGADGRLLRTYRAGVAKLPAYLEDYAFLADGLLRLHSATGDPKRLAQARLLLDRMIIDFSDTKAGGFFYTADDHESLIARPKDPFDNAIPGANSLAIRALVRLGKVTGEEKYLDQARVALDCFSGTLSTSPAGAPLMLSALEAYLDTEAAASSNSPLIVGLPAPTVGGVVKVEAEVEPGEIGPGGDFKVKLTLSIAAGFHIYANPTGTDKLSPTTVDLAADAPFVSEKVSYPPGEAKVIASLGTERVSLYEKSAVIRLRLRLKEGASTGEVDGKLRLNYQACNDRACLAPATIAIPVRIKLKPPLSKK